MGCILQDEYFQINKDAGFQSSRIPVRWTRCVAEAATQRGFSLAYREFCSSFGLYDLQTKSWRKELLEAVGVSPNY